MIEDRFYGYVHFIENGQLLTHFRWFENFTVGDVKKFSTLGQNRQWEILDIVRKNTVFSEIPVYEVHIKEV